VNAVLNANGVTMVKPHIQLMIAVSMSRLVLVATHVKDMLVSALTEIGVLMVYVACQTAVPCNVGDLLVLLRSNLSLTVHVVRYANDPPVWMAPLPCLATVPQSNARRGLSVTDLLLLLFLVVLGIPTGFAASKVNNILC